jgi:enoyl-CoA hydratase/carnithine racemase
MGGGVGISIHAPIRIATENSLFAMPETAIGLFPDVGASWFLPRLGAGLGNYLGLTGSRLTGKDLVRAHIATHYMTPENVEAYHQALKSTTLTNSTAKDLYALTDEFSEVIEEPLAHLDNIVENFDDVTSLEHIFHNLEHHNSDWAKKKLESMHTFSPLSLKVVYEQLKRGAGIKLENAFKMEFRLTQRFM